MIGPILISAVGLITELIRASSGGGGSNRHRLILKKTKTGLKKAGVLTTEGQLDQRLESLVGMIDLREMLENQKRSIDDGLIIVNKRINELCNEEGGR